MLSMAPEVRNALLKAARLVELDRNGQFASLDEKWIYDGDRVVPEVSDLKNYLIGSSGSHGAACCFVFLFL